jgi:hypothetical protein
VVHVAQREAAQPAAAAAVMYCAARSRSTARSSKPRELETAGLQPLRRKRVAPCGGITLSDWAALAHPFGFGYTALMTVPLSTRTVCFKLAVEAAADAALRQTQAAFNAAASYCATVAWEQGVTNKNKLHYLVYRASLMAWAHNWRAAPGIRPQKPSEPCAPLLSDATNRPIRLSPKTCPTFDADGSVRYDARTYRLMSLDRLSSTLSICLGTITREY